MSHADIPAAALVLMSALVSGTVFAGDPPAAEAAVTPPPVATPVPAAEVRTTAATVQSAPAVAPVVPDKPTTSAQVSCREEKRTGSRLQTRKVCSTPDSRKSSADWVREQQARGAIGASAIPNSR